MDKALKERIEEFKSYRVEKPPLEIIEHFKSDLQAIQDSMEIMDIPVILTPLSGHIDPSRFWL